MVTLRAHHARLAPGDGPDAAMTERKAYGAVERATRSELRRLRCSAVTSTLGALAVSLAQHMDAGAEAKDAAVVAGQLRLVVGGGGETRGAPALGEGTPGGVHARPAAPRGAGG